MDLFEILQQSLEKKQAPSRADMFGSVETFDQTDNLTLASSVDKRREQMRKQIELAERTNKMIDDELVELERLENVTPAIKEFIQKIRKYRVITTCQHCDKVCL